MTALTFPMTVLLLPMMALAACGFLLSAVLHWSALTGLAPTWLPLLGEDFRNSLVMGIFVVWFPAAFLAQRMHPTGRGTFSWRALLAGCPPWMRYAAGGLFAYAFVNFFLSVQRVAEGPLSALRPITGHAMLFYGVAFCIFYSAWQRPRMLEQLQCPLGHRLRHNDRFCPECGASAPPPTPGQE